MKLKNAFYEVLISPTQVPEMNRIEVTEEGLLVGGAVTLTKLGKIMKELVKSMPGVHVCVGVYPYVCAGMYVHLSMYFYMCICAVCKCI